MTIVARVTATLIGVWCWWERAKDLNNGTRHTSLAQRPIGLRPNEQRLLERPELCDDSLVSNWRLSLGFSARQIPSGRAQWRTAGLFNAVMEPFNVVRSLN
ncbi:hypothetical protein E5D57_007064 [Metarhizium anisopliae]|nr:hypothetical protein E5D57_007064 [Metarhizium anisopliae]